MRGGAAHALAIVPTDYDNRRDIDLLIVAADGAPALFRNLRDGTFRDVGRRGRAPGAGGSTARAAGDVNKDGFTDFFFGRAGRPGVFALSDGRGRFVAQPAPADAADARARRSSSTTTTTACSTCCR